MIVTFSLPPQTEHDIIRVEFQLDKVRNDLLDAATAAKSAEEAYLTVGDTIRVSEYQNCPCIIGRIVAISYCSTDANEEAVHPHLVGRSLGREEALFKLQLYLPNDNTLVDSAEWNYVPNDIARACRGIVEAAPTNANIWISANHVKCIVFLLHADQCLTQEYGSVVGREIQPISSVTLLK